MTDSRETEPRPANGPGSDADLPTPEVSGSRRWSLSLIWLVPLVAAAAGAILVIRTYVEAGPKIDITFETAEGLEAGKTEVKYKDVVIGKVKHIELADDREHVLVSVDLSKNAGSIAVDNTRFWVVRPRIGVGGISGIGTLLSGAFIGVDIGDSHESRRHFKGLEKPPAITRDLKGRRFILHTSDAGSLAVGSPLYYRKTPVGRIVASDLTEDGKSVIVQVFVDTPFDKFVTENTRFWNASGVDLSINASGLKLNTQALATVIAGGIGFQSIINDDPAHSADADSEYTLFSDQPTALAPPDGPSEEARMRFHQSTRGLSLGAPIDFQGVVMGSVKSILLDYDTNTKMFYTDVVADLFPERLGPADRTLRSVAKSENLTQKQMVQRLIDNGMRAQLKSGSLLTGSLYVSLDFPPNAKPVPYDRDAEVLEIPTAPGSLQEIQTQVADIVRKLDKIPFEQIGNNLRDTLKSANSLLKQLDKELAPQAKKTLEDAQHTIDSLDQGLASPDAPLQQDARKTLEQLNRAAASFRSLADYLEQHPESLIRGKNSDVEPSATSGRK